MSENCGKHQHERGIDVCRRCGGAWCGTCLVYTAGPKKPPYCMSCAMVAGGVRTAAALPAMGRRERKARAKLIRAEALAAAEAALLPDPEGDAEAALVGASGDTDWAAPWWEDRQPTLAD